MNSVLNRLQSLANSRPRSHRSQAAQGSLVAQGSLAAQNPVTAQSSSSLLSQSRSPSNLHQFEFFETVSQSSLLESVTKSPRSSLLKGEDSSTWSISRRTVAKGTSGVIAVRSSKLAKALELVMQERDYFIVALELVQDVQSEFKLRLAWGLVDLRKVDATLEAKKRKVLIGQLNANFLCPGAVLEVTNLPNQFTSLTEANLDSMLWYLLNELATLPEIVSTLPETSQMDHLFQEEEEYCMMSTSDEFEFVQDFDRLAELIKTPTQKRAMLQELVGCPNGAGLLVKIRFVAAIDQYLVCEDRQEKRDLEHMIRKIFLTRGGMFYLDLVGKKLELARIEVLTELCGEENVCAIMDRLVY
ncbi:hypothetical protein BASA81_006502 [Batrachochytrium salamandrivorans]|nr:hypothetical protein BASA81_006502 [Batrachochytrium salamandrivorans]